MKSTTLPLFKSKIWILPVVAMLGVSSAFGAITDVGITSASVDVLTPPTISATVSGRAAAWVNFSYNGATWRKEMNNVGGNAYSLAMPVIPAGTVQYRVEAGDAFDAISTTNALDVSSDYNYAVTETLPELRQPDLVAWRGKVQENASFYGDVSDNWFGRPAMSFDNNLILAGSSNVTSQITDKFIRTKLPLTMGTLYFKARYLDDADSGNTGTIVVETSGDEPFNSAHTQRAVVNVLPTTRWKQYKVPLNLKMAQYLRIRHASGYANGPLNIWIKDIVITDVPADVDIIKNEADHNPGYPSRFDETYFNVTVSNVSHLVSPASNISPKLVWRINRSAWNVTPMRAASGTIQGEDGLYETTLPPQVPGNFEYFYRTDFTGYGYSGKYDAAPPSSGKTAVDNEGDYSIYIDYSVDSTGTWTERQSPAYYNKYYDFPDSQLYNFTVRPPRSINDGSETVYDFDYINYEVRRFRSMHKEMILDFTPFVEATGDYANLSNLTVKAENKMEQVGDYTWQAIVPITNTVSLKSSVRGTARYNDGHPYYEPSVRIWGEMNQDETARNPPMSGSTIDDNGASSAPVVIQFTYDGFFMFRFCTTNGYYEVRRAAWQDFNTWQAPNTEFSRSFGLYETDVYESLLPGNDRKESETPMEPARITEFEFNDNEMNGGNMLAEALIGESAFRVNNAWLFDERVSVSPGTPIVSTRNRALKLNASGIGKGYIETTSFSATAGRDTLTFRARVALDDDHPAIYRDPRAWGWQDYTVTSDITIPPAVPADGVENVSSGNPSVSVYGYYMDQDNYLEGRVTQYNRLQPGRPNSSNNANDSRDLLQLEIWHKANGRLSRIGGAVGSAEGTPRLLADGCRIALKIANDTVSMTVYAANTTTLIGSVPNSGAAPAIPANPLVEAGGTVGVGASDCSATFATTITPEGGGSNRPSQDDIDAFAASASTKWSLGGNQEGGSQARWTFAKGTLSNPSKITKAIPQVPYRIKVYRTGSNTDDDSLISNAQWDENWDKLGTEQDAIRNLTSYGWQEVSVTFHFWDNARIRIEPVGSDGHLVIDDIGISGWQGHTIYDPPLSSVAGNENLAFRTTFGVFKDDREIGGAVYELDRTRANTEDRVEAEQYIVSPLLEDGIGDIAFNYSVITGNVEFVVEALQQNETPFLELFRTNVSESAIGRCYVPALTNVTGKLRILIIKDGTSPNAIMRIRNIKVTNYPDVGDTSWEAYNMRISTFEAEAETNPDIKFDGAANVTFRSAIINNSQTEETSSGGYTEDAPYLQSPTINTGVGEVSFWYRLFPGGGASPTPGKFYLKAAMTHTAPPEEWVTFNIGHLNPAADSYELQAADLETSTNVVNSEWRYFSVEFFAQQYKVLRIYGDIEGAGRVMFDNVIVTEPVRTSIEIGTVATIPAIPLRGDKVGFDVRLINPSMNPKNIKVFAHHIIGTNTWGQADILNAPGVELDVVDQITDPYHFVLAPEKRIPGQPVDTVVQYAIQVTYEGTFAEPVYYTDFSNPPWYEPVDLNKQFSSSGASTPHYFVFSVGTNSVFINEFMPYVDNSAGIMGLPEQFVELIGSMNGDISNWRLEHVLPARSMNSDYVYWTNVMAQGATLADNRAPSENPRNWGFYVLANDGLANSSHIVQTPPPVVNQVLFPFSLYELNPLDSREWRFAPANVSQIALGDGNESGALILRRSMGAYVDRIVWGTVGSDYPEIGNMIARGFKHVNARSPSPSAVEARRPYVWTWDPGTGAMTWQVDNRIIRDENNAWRAQASPGYYNNSQEYNIWEAPQSGGSDSEEPPSEFALIEVKIVGIAPDGDSVDITFQVRSTNGVALESGDYTWSFDTGLTLEALNSDPVPANVIQSIEAPADGSWIEYSQIIDLGTPAPQSSFFRIKATPTLP